MQCWPCPGAPLISTTRFLSAPWRDQPCLHSYAVLAARDAPCGCHTGSVLETPPACGLRPKSQEAIPPSETIQSEGMTTLPAPSLAQFRNQLDPVTQAAGKWWLCWLSYCPGCLRDSLVMQCWPSPRTPFIRTRPFLNHSLAPWRDQPGLHSYALLFARDVWRPAVAATPGRCSS